VADQALAILGLKNGVIKKVLARLLKREAVDTIREVGVHK
jgi:hypothetical protein